MDLRQKIISQRFVICNPYHNPTANKVFQKRGPPLHMRIHHEDVPYHKFLFSINVNLQITQQYRVTPADTRSKAIVCIDIDENSCGRKIFSLDNVPKPLQKSQQLIGYNKNNPNRPKSTQCNVIGLRQMQEIQAIFFNLRVSKEATEEQTSQL